jgi:AP-2 complex subunit alpha
LFKNNGVLFENEMIQIGVKSEFRQNLGRLGLFYGNKTQVPLVNFQPVLQWPAESATKLNVQIKAVDSTLDAGAQIQQMITAECIDSYSGEKVKNKSKVLKITSIEL